MPPTRRLSCFRPLGPKPSPALRLSNAYRSRRQMSDGPRSATIEAQALIHSKYGEPEDVLELNTHAISRSVQGTVLLRTLAAPINPSDVNAIQATYGHLPRMVDNPFGIHAASTQYPSAIPGNEGAFEVMATGTDVPPDQFKVGDWVIPLSPGYGTWRTHVLAQASSSVLWRIPHHLKVQGLTPVQAATVSVNPLTALRLISDFGTRWDVEANQERRGLGPGDWLLQNGANSAVGRLVIQLAKLKGFKTLNVIRQRQDDYQTEALRQELLALGADVVMTDSQLGRLVRETLKTVTGGRGASLMLNCVGGKAAGALAKNLNEGGEVVTYGAMSKVPVTLGAGGLIFKELNFRGFWVSRWGQRFETEKTKAMEELLGLVVGGKIEIPRAVEVHWDVEKVKEQGNSKLVKAVQETLQGFKGEKRIFVF